MAIQGDIFMTIDSFKNIFINNYKNVVIVFNSIFNLSKDVKNNLQKTSNSMNLEYQDKLITDNTTGIKEYDFSHLDYQNFHSQFLNNTFFLNEKNKPVLEKIHEDLTFVYDIFNFFKEQQIGVELVLTGGAIRDFILGKSEQIKDLDITVNITSNYQHFLMYQQCHTISSVIETVLREKNIHYDKLCDLSKNFELRGMYNNIHNLLEEVIEIKGKHFPIQLLCTTNSNTLIKNFDFDISKIGLRLFSDYKIFKEITFPESLEQYVSRLEYGAEFVSHVLSKKLSYHNGGKNNEQIMSELTNHFPRVALKYPDFVCDIFSPHDENYSFTKQLFDKALLFNQFNNKLENLEHTEHKTKVRKI